MHRVDTLDVARSRVFAGRPTRTTFFQLKGDGGRRHFCSQPGLRAP